MYYYINYSTIELNISMSNSDFAINEHAEG